MVERERDRNRQTARKVREEGGRERQRETSFVYKVPKPRGKHLRPHQ